MRDESRRAFLADCKNTGRFEVSYAPSRKVAHFSRFYIQDKMTFKTVAEYDVAVLNDDQKARRRAADEDAARNAAWAAEGYPGDWSACDEE